MESSLKRHWALWHPVEVSKKRLKGSWDGAVLRGCHHQLHLCGYRGQKRIGEGLRKITFKLSNDYLFGTVLKWKLDLVWWLICFLKEKSRMFHLMLKIFKNLVLKGT